MTTLMPETAWQNRYDQAGDSLEKHFDLRETPEAQVALGGALHVLSWREEVEDTHFPARETGADLLG